MTKMNQTPQDQTGMQARPAEVHPSQHQHTDDIAFPGAGDSDDDELQETAIKQVSSASPKSTATPPVGGKAVTTKGGMDKTSPDPHEIKFLAVGVSKKGGKFLLVANDDKHVVLSVRNLARDPAPDLERLQALDV